MPRSTGASRLPPLAGLIEEPPTRFWSRRRPNLLRARQRGQSSPQRDYLPAATGPVISAAGLPTRPTEMAGPGVRTTRVLARHLSLHRHKPHKPDGGERNRTGIIAIACASPILRTPGWPRPWPPDGKRRKMPRACRLPRGSLRSWLAPRWPWSVRLHGTSPCHLGSGRPPRSSDERNDPRGKASRGVGVA